MVSTLSCEGDTTLILPRGMMEELWEQCVNMQKTKYVSTVQQFKKNTKQKNNLDFYSSRMVGKAAKCMYIVLITGILYFFGIYHEDI